MQTPLNAIHAAPAQPEQHSTHNNLDTAAVQRPETLLRLQEVIRRTGMCKTKIYTLEGFPKPIKVGGHSSAWIESEVDSWIALTIAEARRARAA